MSVNEIIEQTSTDRTFVIRALSKLEKAGFIITIKTRSHKQKKVKQLSKLGHILAQLTFNIENLNVGHFEINKVIDEYKEIDKKFNDIKEKNKPLTTIRKNTFRELVPNDRTSQRFLKEKLKEKGWTDKELSYYEECKEGLYYTDIYLHEGTIQILLQKFLSILDNFDLNVSAREIINRIIIEKFLIQLSNIVTNIRTLYPKYLISNTNKTHNSSQYYPSFKYEPLDYIDKLRFSFQYPVMKIVKKMMSSYLNLLEPSKRNIIQILRDTRKNFENSSTYEVDDGDINKEDIKMSSRCLIEVYKKYVFSN